MKFTRRNARTLLRALLDAALAAADPDQVVPPHLPEPPAGRTIVLGAGKAAAKMARAVEAHWPGPISGLVVTRYAHSLPCRHIEVVEAAHPVPDAAGLEAAGRILDLAHEAGPEDLVLCLISGGASALLSLPAEGVTLEDKQAVSRALLSAGARIQDLNAVRKHLSAIKGGRLAAAAAPAHVMSLIISDVVGDDPSVIGSGPTAPDPTTYADARAALAAYGIDPPEAVRRHLADAKAETPKPGDGLFENIENRVIASARGALLAAVEESRRRGVHAFIHSDAVEGEARAAAENHVRYLRHRKSHGVTPLPAVMLSGGELTVNVTGDGTGGPNQEFLLAAALALDGEKGVYGLAADTDGTDGRSEAAGAFIDPATLARAGAAGLDAGEFLERNDAHGFFAALDDSIVTGPTLTNVNDFRAFLIDGA